MIDTLTLVFNQARQASITREISEISAGKAALE
jgi:F0F1-type ATP synthase gamma subunit